MTTTPWLAFSIDRASKKPVFEQICEALRQSIIGGSLAEGAKLPPTRVLATELGVSRSTTVTAYEQLVAEGYLHSQRGSGFTVCAVGEADLAAKPGHRPQTEDEAQVKLPLPFEAGQPDMRLFPHRQWAKAVARVCRTTPQLMLMGGTAAGNFELRKAIAAHVAEWRGIEASPHQILITAGSTDALDLCLRVLSSRGEVIGLEDPGYAPLRHIAQFHGLQPAYLEIDEQGAKLPEAEYSPRLVILTPSHQFPLGGAMSPNRRQKFISWAQATGGWVIEDDYDSEFRYAGRPIPAMAGFDRLRRVIYVGSFSKIFSNSLRLGYVVVPEDLLEQFRPAIGRSGLRASYMPQQALAEFMHSGEFYRHLRRVRRTYGERRKFLLDRLVQDFGGLGWFRDHQAGMQTVLHLPGSVHDKDVARRAADQGVTVQPLSRFSASGAGPNGLLLGFCGFSEAEMSPALDVLKLCLEVGTSAAGG
ncbi:MocR-like pyridoxine biosynthesis transcription factor PdxR [Leisingera sp. ANG-Vp]|uniref:MocR-like pyridoxine biosynthesis transcription factor PdxR n=1 Tax=Leisingera sp. ANG-Vp TaxID=1577896 RepID=UPI00057FE4E9|nr:PLP-dependent aminotransferase family protein [Leisingera sp. ANG-Vp]KIC15383.1 aspartate aminotransferase [Leisingera sp. ANG-Vp]